MTHRPKCQKKGEGIMKTKLNDGMKQLVARVPEEVHRALKIRAAEEGKSAAVIVEGLIRHYLLHGSGRCGKDCIFGDKLNDGRVIFPKGAAHD
jgi:hypothetical protein